MADDQDNMREVLFALEGDRKARSLKLAPGATVKEFLSEVRAFTGRAELEEVFLEDVEAAIEGDQVVLEKVAGEDFKLLHVATPGKIAVTVVFNGQTREQPFSPSVTMDTIVRWAMSAFGLEGDASDFQLKDGDDILQPSQHLGQVGKGHKAVRLALVMKIKPQGASDGT